MEAANVEKFVTIVVLEFIGKVWNWLLKAANEKKPLQS